MTNTINPLLRLRPATEADAEYLAPRLRDADIKELAAITRLSPLEVLLTGIGMSKPAAVALVDCKTDLPYLIGGVSPAPSLPSAAVLAHEYGTNFISKVGMVWLLASPEIERHSMDVHREAKAYLSRLMSEGQYTALCNVVSADNEKAVSWLSCLGFTFALHSQPLGLNGELFLAFAIAAAKSQEREVA